jgi:hypothetical protein
MEADEFVLGEEVTQAARGKPRRETAVLSVRLSVEEIAELEALSRASGKSMSQILREALLSYVHQGGPVQPTITVSVFEGPTFSTGKVTQASYAAETEKVA